MGCDLNAALFDTSEQARAPILLEGNRPSSLFRAQQLLNLARARTRLVDRGNRALLQYRALKN